jgi:hypothetical protein
LLLTFAVNLKKNEFGDRYTLPACNQLAMTLPNWPPRSYYYIMVLGRQTSNVYIQGIRLPGIFKNFMISIRNGTPAGNCHQIQQKKILAMILSSYPKLQLKKGSGDQAGQRRL